MERKMDVKTKEKGKKHWKYAVGLAIGIPLGTCAGSCAGEPDKYYRIDATGDGKQDIVLEDRGYCFGLWGVDHYVLTRDGSKNRILDGKTLIERIAENAENVEVE